MNADGAVNNIGSTPDNLRVIDGALLQALGESPTVAAGDSGSFPGAQDSPPGEALARFDGDAVLILYGTVTGNAELLAHRLAKRLRLKGVGARLCDMAQGQPNLLAQARYALAIVSTCGDGEPPEDAAPFWRAVVRAGDLDLHGVEFSVLALGNTTYDHFCRAGRELDAALERRGARRFYPRFDCDADYDAAAGAWMEGVLGHF